MDEQRRVDIVRVRGYALIAADAAIAAKNVYEAAADRLNRARRDVEHAQERLRAALEQSELAARCAVSDDAEWQAEVAQCLERLFG